MIDKLGNQVRNLGANDKVDPTLKVNIPGLTLGEAPPAGSSGDTSGQADGQGEGAPKQHSKLMLPPGKPMRGDRNLRLISLACVLLAFAAGSGAQAALRVLRVADFGGDGIDRGEAAALQSLVTSYVVELKAFRVIDKAGQELAVKEEETAVQMGVAKAISPIAADYILSAEADRAGTLIVFSIDVTKVATGEKKSVAETFASVNDLILASRRLTRKLFEQPVDNPAKQARRRRPRRIPSPASASWQGPGKATRTSTGFPFSPTEAPSPCSSRAAECRYWSRSRDRGW